MGRLSQPVSIQQFLWGGGRVGIPQSSVSDAPIHPSVPAMALANLASRLPFSGVSSQVQYGRLVACDKLNAVGESTGPVSGVGTRGGETGKPNERSSVWPDNLGRDNSRRMTGCARASGDFDALCVEGNADPDVREIGGRSVGALVASVAVAELRGSMPLLRDNGSVKWVRFKLVSGKGRSASVKYADALKSSSVL
jgi:hypothetical protein